MSGAALLPYPDARDWLLAEREKIKMDTFALIAIAIAIYILADKVGEVSNAIDRIADHLIEGENDND